MKQQPPREYMTIRILAALKRQIEKIAKNERRSLSQVGEMLLEQALKDGGNHGRSSI